MTTKAQLLTIADWDAMPLDDGNRYEIIEGELFVSCSPGLTHQIVLSKLLGFIWDYLKTNPIGTVVPGPGLILSKYSGVIPDLVFYRHDQTDTIIANDRLNGPPALVVEILSPGAANTRRDRVAKLQLYAKHQVPEYWLVNPQSANVEKYGRQGSSLILEQTLAADQILLTNALPGFSCRVGEFFSQF